jgi:thymidylate synthase (FAD)
MKDNATVLNVLDKGFVRLVDSMGDDLSVVNAARVSFGKQKEQFDKRDERLVKYLWEHKHTSPFRHATVKFHIKAPVFVFRQWQKHQVGCSWNELSGRYVEFQGDCYEPITWRKQHTNNKQGSQGAIEQQALVASAYKKHIDDCLILYKGMIANGVCKEQARLVLPHSLYTECIWTCSLQAAMHFLTLREDEHSQWEIQQYAQAVRKLIEPLFPISLSIHKKENDND